MNRVGGKNEKPATAGFFYWNLFGERGRNRTYNLLIKSQLLCQLSYASTSLGDNSEFNIGRRAAASSAISFRAGAGVVIWVSAA